MGTGQFCTNPGRVITVGGETTSQFIDDLVNRFSQAPVGTLLSAGVQQSLGQSLATLLDAGGDVLVGNQEGGGSGYSFANTLIRITAEQFIADPETMQTEAFGNAALLVVADDIDQVCRLVDQLEGNLTGCIYSHSEGRDDPDYDRVAPRLRNRVGRLLNDKMPTGVAVSPAMNHGGPYPATGHPGFTAVGIPASLIRFAMLQSYDNIRPHRLPPALQDKNPSQSMWRNIDGQWTQADIS
jgi:NADP-dependent aldehyde dehydrogenase